jgi:hypothetical protein
MFRRAIVAQLWHGMIDMTKTASVAEVLRAGVTIEPEEAVAIAQELIASLCRGDRPLKAGPPYGPPTSDNVTLGDDGTVSCRTCETTPAVSEIAIFLQAILPPPARVPGGLRYTIARALLDVDVPPFDSLADLAETLVRYERGPRAPIVARVMQRYANRVALAPLRGVERRSHPRTTELRRSLREADARLYLQKVATETVALTVTAPPKRPADVRTGAACVAAGLLMIAAGELIDRPHHDVDPARATAPAAAAPDVPRAMPLVEREPGTMNPEARAVNVRTESEPSNLNPARMNIDRGPANPSTDAVIPGPARRPSNRQPRTSNQRTSNDGTSNPRTANPRTSNSRTSNHRTSNPRALNRRTPNAEPRTPNSDPGAPRRGLLERLRLNWLRNALTSL